MRVKDFVRRALFENYLIEIENGNKVKLFSKDDVFKQFGWMHVTEIDYTIILTSKDIDFKEKKPVVIPYLLIKD